MTRSAARWLVLVAGACLCLALAGGPALAGHKRPERAYQAEWCQREGGRMEVVMPDGTRCDCMTADHAWEFDFARKWAEAIGQALNYAMHTGRAPGVVLIVEREADFEHAARVQRIASRWGLPIRVVVILAMEDSP